MNRIAPLAAAALILGGCAAPEPQQTPPAQPQPEAAAPKPVTPPPPARPAPGSPEARAQAQQLLRRAYESLNEGDDQKAQTELQEIRELEPENKQAACLLKGITADPAAALGKQSNPYTVRPGESLGTIARRALGDVCEFYLLARYNNIKVPKQLGAGQTIRIPGKVALAAPDAPAASPAAAPPIAPPVEVAKPPAPEPPLVREAAVPAKPAGPSKEEITKQEQIQRHHRNAQAAFRRQDLATAIKEWDRVLELDPSNELAQARRQEALDMSRRLKELK